MNSVQISFVVNCFKRPDRIKKLLNSIYSANIEISFEFIAISYEFDRSGVVEFLLEEKSKNNIDVILNKIDVGKAESRNQGIRMARGKYVYILDDDTEINRKAVEEIYYFMENNPTCGICSPKLLNSDGSFQPSARKFPTFFGKIFRNLPFPSKFIDDLYKNYDQIFKVDYLIGASQFVRKAMFEKTGYIDPNSGNGVEDIEICVMAWSKGYSIYYIPSVSIYHHQSFAIKKEFFSKKTAIHFFSLLYFFRKWGYFFSRDRFYKRLNLKIDKNGLIV